MVEVVTTLAEMEAKIISEKRKTFTTPIRLNINSTCYVEMRDLPKYKTGTFLDDGTFQVITSDDFTLLFSIWAIITK